MTNIIDKIRVSGTDYTLSATSSGGNPTVELTQAEYDALVSAGTVSADTYYIITDAQAGDLTQYWTSAQTNSAINQAVSGKVDTTTFNTYSGNVETALSGKQDTLVSGTNIKTINNESILGSGNIYIQGGSGGKAIEAGRGISVASGDSAYTVSFSLPISGGSGTNSIIIGAGETGYVAGSLVHGIGSTSTGVYSNVFGYNCFSNGHYSFLAGGYLKNYIEYGAVFGKYNDTTNSPLFSVGNGTADNARHNVFEIRQNGDIYLTLDGQDVKLQDHLGGGGGKAISAGTNISVTTGETADTINCTLPASASSGNYSIMFGQPASSGDASGSKTITGGQWSKAFSEGAVSIGQMNEARGQWAWAIGNITRTNGKASFACGDYTSANAKYAFSEGTNTTANTEASHAAGRYTKTTNRGEFSIGEYNNSVSASTTFGDSGNTLFSVGNGTDNNARHNAFEIRQNGDIYLSNGTNDVKLQDYIQIKAVKISQSDYDQLQTKDPNTLYIITTT